MIKLYMGFLRHAVYTISLQTTHQDIAHFLDSLKCTNGAKHAYYRALRIFYRWLYSGKSGCNLNSQNNPILNIESLKIKKKILPGLTKVEVITLSNLADNLRDKVIIELFADSGMRLSEMVTIKVCDIDWDSCTVTIVGKGNKQGRAPFTKVTAKQMQSYINKNNCDDRNIWGINQHGIKNC